MIILIFLALNHFSKKSITKDRQEYISIHEYEKNITVLQKEYGIKILTLNSLLEKNKDEKKIEFEKLSKEWEIKYTKSIEEATRILEKIKYKSVLSSKREFS